MHNTPKQHTLWLLAATAAPLAHFSGCGWFSAVLAALAVLPLTFLPKRWEGLGKPLSLLQILWLGSVAGMLLKNSAAYWPSDNDLVVPLTLLALAVCTKAASAPRIGAVLAFCIALLAVPVAVSGAAHIEPGWLSPAVTPWPAGLSLALLLPNLPAAGEGQKGRRFLGIGVLTVLLALLVQGVTATPVALAVPDPFYQTARTLGHLEPVVAAGISLGWYTMASFLLHSAERIAQEGGIGGRTAYVLATGTAAGFVMIPQQPNGWFWTLLSAFLWVLIPFLNRMKNSEKREK